ncbi:hypothetical protein SEA_EXPELLIARMUS_24 [Mycobacterium phage Expelliarmus]|nr:hypothetical protein SEA_EXPELLIARMUS_24 [Mycobacterium phage Expelliarmus]
MAIPTQAETDFNDPEEHFLWALHNMPTVAGFGAVTNPLFMRSWSKHLWECGFAHRDHLESLADENGMIHVSQLPDQQKKLQPAIRGPYSAYNQAARWVPMDQEPPPPMVLQDPAELTQQEQQAVVKRLIEVGAIQAPKTVMPVAEEFN